MTNDELMGIISAIQELGEDNCVPRNVKNKLDETRKVLEENEELPVRVNKALNVLDEIADDTNLQPYTRTQLWNVVSMLESI